MSSLETIARTTRAGGTPCNTETCKTENVLPIYFKDVDVTFIVTKKESREAFKDFIKNKQKGQNGRYVNMSFEDFIVEYTNTNPKITNYDQFINSIENDLKNKGISFSVTISLPFNDQDVLYSTNTIAGYHFLTNILEERFKSIITMTRKEFEKGQRNILIHNKIQVENL